MGLAKDLRRVTAVVLVGEALYLIALTIVLGRFSASMRNFDGQGAPGVSVGESILGVLAAIVLSLTAVLLWRTSGIPNRSSGLTGLFTALSVIVNGVLLVLGLSSGAWSLVGAAVIVMALLAADTVMTVSRPRGSVGATST